MRLAYGIPIGDAFPNPFNAPDPGGLRRAMLWLVGVRAVGLGGGVAAIDGKALRRSFAAAASRSLLHPVRAFVGGARPVLGQVRVEDKLNGIAAVPALLGMPAPKGRTMTADAMRTRRRRSLRRGRPRAGTERQPGAPYEDVRPYPDDPAQDGNRLCHQDLGGSHGRIGTRTVGVAHDIDRLQGRHCRPWPAAVGKVVAMRGTRAGTGDRDPPPHHGHRAPPGSGSGTRCAAVG